MANELTSSVPPATQRSSGGGMVPAFGFAAATVLGALLLVCGSTIIYFDYRLSPDDLWDGLWGKVGITALGFALIVLALAGHRAGPARKTVIIVRNALVGLVALAVLGIVLLLLIGPMH